MYYGTVLQHHPSCFSYHQINRFGIYLASISSDVLLQCSITKWPIPKLQLHREMVMMAERTNFAFVHSRQPENSEHSKPFIGHCTCKDCNGIMVIRYIFACLSLLGTNRLDKICWMKYF